MTIIQPAQPSQWRWFRVCRCRIGLSSGVRRLWGVVFGKESMRILVFVDVVEGEDFAFDDDGVWRFAQPGLRGKIRCEGWLCPLGVSSAGGQGDVGWGVDLRGWEVGGELGDSDGKVEELVVQRGFYGCPLVPVVLGGLPGGVQRKESGVAFVQ